MEIFGKNFITHLAMVVVEEQLKTVGVGVGVVVHVLQPPGEGMVLDHQEGVGVEDHQADDEEAYLQMNKWKDPKSHNQPLLS